MLLARRRPPRGTGAAALPALNATILRRCLLLAAAAALPLVLLGAWIVRSGGESVREAVEGRMLDAARTLAGEVDREFERGETALLALAASTALRRGDLDGFEEEMRTVARGMGVHVGLATPDGFQVLNTIWMPGERRLRVEAPAVALDVFATGRAAVSDLFLGPSDGRPVVALAVPAPAAGAAAPAGPYALGFIVPRERFRDMLGRATTNAADHWGAAVFDRTGRFVARSRGDRRAVGQQAQPDMLALLAGGGEGIARDRRDREGNPNVAAYARAPRSGFGVVVGANPDLLYAPLRSTARRGAAAAAAVLLACFAWAVVGSRRVSAAFGRVPERVAAAAGEGPAGWTTGLREADDLAAALAAGRARGRAHGQRTGGGGGAAPPTVGARSA